MATSGDSLRKARMGCGLSQSELARRTGISRQALGAIESGVYLPSVTVALNLARELGETVESLFGRSDEAVSKHIDAIWNEKNRPAEVAAHVRVALARVYGKIVAIDQPAARLTLAPAAGTLERVARNRAEVSTFRSEDEIASTLLIAGCDPAASMLADWFARRRSAVCTIALPCSSVAALEALRDGRAHAAGIHLRDPKSGEYNSAAVCGALGRRSALLVNFARWELGLAAAPRNPLAISGFADLVRPNLRIINREPGSGARAALDEGLEALGVEGDRIDGYGRTAPGHLEVAAAIASGHADAGVTIRVAADAYGLVFIPLREERYDLVILEHDSGTIPVKAMLDALNSRRFAREISQFCTYDTDQMGKVIAELR